MTTAAAPAAGAPAAPVPGSPEYDAAMAEKFRSTRGAVDDGLLARFTGTAPETDTSAAAITAAAETKARPDHVPEKFWDAEKGEVRIDALLKSYGELESGKAPAVDPAAAADSTAKPDGDAAAAVEAAGLNWDDLGSKVNAKGELDATDYEALAKVGVPREVVDRYVQLVQGERAAATEAAYTYAGGKEATDALLGWAAQNLQKDQIEGYNAMLAGPNWKVALDTLKTLKGKTSPTAGEPNLTHTPGLPGAGGVVGYRSEDDMKVAMRDPRYFAMTPEGAAYRAEVQEKVRLAAYRR